MNDMRHKMHIGGMFSGAGSSIITGHMGGFKAQDRPPIISINLEDVILHEEKLCNILEVSYFHPFNFSFVELEKRPKLLVGM